MWTVRSLISSWLMSASLAIMPNRRDAADVRAALAMLKMRDEVVARSHAS